MRKGLSVQIDKVIHRMDEANLSPESIAGVSQSSAGLRLVGKPPGALKGNAIAKQQILEQKKSRECEVLTME